MLLVVGTVRLPPKGVEAARQAISQMVVASRAEGGCIEYVYAEDVLDEGLIHVKELWRDRASLDAHFQTEHLKTWRSSWGALGVRDRRLNLYYLGEPEPI